MTRIDDMVWSLMAVGAMAPGVARTALAAEEERARAEVRARTVGHPKWENACSVCGCQLELSQGAVCYACQLRRIVAPSSLDLTRLPGV